MKRLQLSIISGSESSPEVLAALISVRDRAMVLLEGSTGLRRSEFIALTWADVNATTLGGQCAALVCLQSLRGDED